MIAVGTSDIQDDGHSSGSDASSDNKLRRAKTSAREKNRRLAQRTQCFGGHCEGSQHKHNESRSVIRNTSLDEYYSRNQTTECLFAVADQVDEGRCEGALLKSFRAKVSGWIHTKNLLYDRLRNEKGVY